MVLDPLQPEAHLLWTENLAKTRINKEVSRLPLDTPIHPNKVRIVCISDTHEKFSQVLDKIPDGDILVHCGDFTNNGSVKEVEEFDQLIGGLPHKVKILIAGNHELGFDDTENEDLRYDHDKGKGTKKGYNLLKNVVYLHDKQIEVCGLKIYGSSWHPLPRFPFARSRKEELHKEWEKIPADTDIILTHTPPLGYRDHYFDPEGYEPGHWGCVDLLKKVEEIKPQLHVFGHVHEQNGIVTNGDTVFVNASLCSHRLDPRFPPVIIDLDFKGSEKNYSVKFL